MCRGLRLKEGGDEEQRRGQGDPRRKGRREKGQAEEPGAAT